jgi:hypothetical protein
MREHFERGPHENEHSNMIRQKWHRLLWLTLASQIDHLHITLLVKAIRYLFRFKGKRHRLLSMAGVTKKLQ